MSPAGTGKPVKPVKTGASGGGAREHLLQLLGPAVASVGYDLEDISVTSAGRRSLVRVSVDADGGIDLDAVAQVSRLISEVLDADGPFGSNAAFSGPYVLEVGSPGVDRPLVEERHWRRSLGRLVKVTAGDDELTGRVLAADDAGVTLDVAGSERVVAWSQLGSGKVQVEFNRADDHDSVDDEDGGG
ncbi:MAG TPA: ribosome maturation factor RimP [Jatrophihabitans sp.]|jgi:ribosome maturation factor RimP